MIWAPGFEISAGILVAFVVPALAGWLLIRRLPSLSGREALALAYPAGLLLTAALLLASLCFLSAVAAAYVTLAALLLVIVTGIVRRGRGSTPPAASEPVTGIERGLAAYLVVLAAVLLVRVLLAPTEGYDSVANFALKGHHLATKGLDASFFQRGYPHPSYPPYVPLQDAWTSLALGRWDDRLIRVFPVLLFASFLAFTASFLRGLGLSGLQSLGSLALFASSPALLQALREPLADAPLALHVALAAMLLWRARVRRGLGDRLLAGIAVGAVTLIKKEGLVYAIVLLALPLVEILRSSGSVRSRLRDAATLAAPTLLFASSWWLVLSTHGVNAGFGEKPYGPLDPSAVPAALLRTMRYYGRDALFSQEGVSKPDDWLLLVPALALIVLTRPRAFRRQGAWYLGIAAAASAIHAVVLLLAPWPHEWLLMSTVDRLVLQVMPLLFLAFASSLAGPADST